MKRGAKHPDGSPKTPALVAHENKVLSIVVCMAASFIELFTTLDMCVEQDTCDHARIQLALYVGGLGALLCLFRLPLFRYRPAVSLYDIHLGFVLTLMWAFGVAFNTSTGGPFTKTNNGYYSTWIALVAAGSFAYVSAEDVVRQSVDIEIARQDKALVIVFFASLVEMSVAADVCDIGDCTGHEAVAVALGLVSLFLVGTHITLVRRSHPLNEITGRILGPLSLAIWAAAAGVNTSTGGPFTSSCDEAVPAANGFFSTWIAFFASLYYAWTQLLAFLPHDALYKTFGGDKCDGMGLESHDQPYQPLPTIEDQ